MKTTKIYLVVCLTFLLTQFTAFAQYNGGVSDGATSNQLSATSCSTPAHFYAYFGGNNDGSSVEELSTTTCGTAPFQFAYMGGNADGAATEELSANISVEIQPSILMPILEVLMMEQVLKLLRHNTVCADFQLNFMLILVVKVMVITIG